MREQLGFGTKCVSDLTYAEKAAGAGAWKSTSRYGRRWTAETIFSALKRIFGSYTHSPKWKNIVQEVNLKMAPHSKLVSVASGRSERRKGGARAPSRIVMCGSYADHLNTLASYDV